MSDPFDSYDSWLNSGNPADIPDVPEEGICPHCDEEMTSEADVDNDPETGKHYYSGGGVWFCTNKSCLKNK